MASSSKKRRIRTVNQVGDYSSMQGNDYLNKLTQGFEATGQYYLIFQEHPEIKIHIVYFDQNELQKNLLRVQVNEIEENGVKRNRETHFDPYSANLVHTVANWLRVPGKWTRKLVVDIYHYSLFDVLTKNDYLLTIDESRKPDLSIDYGEEKYNFVRYNAWCRNQNGNIFFVKAINLDKRTYKQKHCRIDVVYMTVESTKHHKNVTIDTSIFEKAPMIYLAGEKIYAGFESTMKLLEYDFDGNICYEYPLYGKNIFMVKSDDINEGGFYLTYSNDDGRKQLVKLHKGEFMTVKSINEDKFRKEMNPHNREFETYGISKKLDRYLLAYSKQKLEDVIYKHRYFDLRTHQKSNAIRISTMCCGIQDINSNWNGEEVVLTYINKENEFILKAVPIKYGNDFPSLKHLARLSTLTSFDEIYIKNFNMPASIFEYLGIEK
eukprot:TCONS_00050853-protein